MNLALDNPYAKVSAITLELALLDVPLRIECTQGASVAIAAACRGWGGRATSLSAPLQLRIETSSALSGTCHTAIHVDGSRMTVRGPGVVARAEVDQGFADCMVSAEYLKDAVALRHEVLEPLALMLLTHRDRTPLHASAFIVDDLAILLAGPTGAGKSCLARAADVAGLQVLSDDTVYVQLAPCLTVWGWPTAAHLFARDAPDAAGPTRLRNGKVKHVVPLRSASQAAIACNHAVLCLLSPSQGGEAALSRISAAVVEERFWPLDEGFDLLPGPIAAAVARLSAGGAWDLRLSADPAEAVRLLTASLPRLRCTASVPPA
jgi:hypothetical protein